MNVDKHTRWAEGLDPILNPKNCSQAEGSRPQPPALAVTEYMPAITDYITSHYCRISCVPGTTFRTHQNKTGKNLIAGEFKFWNRDPCGKQVFKGILMEERRQKGAEGRELGAKGKG